MRMKREEAQEAARAAAAGKKRADTVVGQTAERDNEGAKIVNCTLGCGAQMTLKVFSVSIKHTKNLNNFLKADQNDTNLLKNFYDCSDLDKSSDDSPDACVGDAWICLYQPTT